MIFSFSRKKNYFLWQAVRGGMGHLSTFVVIFFSLFLLLEYFLSGNLH